MTDNAVTPHEGVWIPDGLEARVEVMKERLHSEGYSALNNLRVAVAYARIAFHNKDTEWASCSACGTFARVFSYTQDRRTELDPNADLWVMNDDYSFCYSCVVRKSQSRTCNRDEVTLFQYDDYEQACNIRIGQAFPVENMPEATQPAPSTCPCGSYILPRHMRLGLNTEGVEVEAHSDCVSHCSVCDRNLLQIGRTANFRMIDGTSHCPSCSDTALEGGDYTDCEHCNEWFHTDDMEWSNERERNLCENCYRRPVTCNDCECRYTEGESHECYREEGDTIYSYSYKPKAKFFGQGKYHLGFELEVEESDGNGEERNYCAGLIEMKLGERVYMKYDGSLDDGFEVVTHPHTLEEYTTNFDWSFLNTLVTQNFVSWNNSNCGFHVHISRTAFDSPTGYQSEVSHKMRFTKFIYDNQYQVERIAGRKSNDFATFSDKGAILNKVLHHDQRNGRYEVVNVYNEHTYEIRIFKGSLRKARLLSNLEFVHAVCEYTRNMKVVAKHTPFAWSRFIKYVTDNDTRYPNLMLIIDEAFSSERIKSEV